jgi:branched-chain amino acid transport system substrate-binding protein
LAIVFFMGCDEGGSDGVEEGQVVIPVLVPTTGGLGAQGVVWEYGVLLAQKEINEAGGVMGQDLFLDIRDSKTDPEEGVRLAEAFFSDYETRFLIHSDGSDSALAIAEQVALPKNALMIVTVAGTTAYTTIEETTDLCFRSVPANDQAGSATAAFILEDQFTNAAVYYEEHPYTQTLAESFVAYMEENGGTITGDVSCPSPPGEGYDYVSDLTEVESGSPEAVYLATYPEAGMSFLETWGVQGTFDGGWYLDAIFRTEELFATLEGTDLEGMCGINPLGNPEALAVLQAAMQEEFGEGADLTVSRLGETYDAVYLLALAIQKAGTTDTIPVRDALREIASPPGEAVGPGEFKKAIDLIAAGKDINYEGAGGNVDFDDDGNVSSDFELWEIQGDEFVGIGTWTP